MQLIRNSAPNSLALRISAEADFRLYSRSRNPTGSRPGSQHDVILAILSDFGVLRQRLGRKYSRDGAILNGQELGAPSGVN
jgi:hypothetical protein